MEKVPLRLVLREGRPMLIEITIENTRRQPRKYVVYGEAEELSFSSTGRERRFVKRVGTVLPGGTARVDVRVYPRPTTRPGEYTVRLRVEECVDSYDYVESSKEIVVPVVVI